VASSPEGAVGAFVSSGAGWAIAVPLKAKAAANNKFFMTISSCFFVER
jgi:hypothetical protein